MEDLYKNIEMFFEKLPISRNNMALKKAFIEEIDAEYEELKKENTEEETTAAAEEEEEALGIGLADWVWLSGRLVCGCWSEL